GGVEEGVDVDPVSPGNCLPTRSAQWPAQSLGVRLSARRRRPATMVRGDLATVGFALRPLPLARRLPLLDLVQPPRDAVRGDLDRRREVAALDDAVEAHPRERYPVPRSQLGIEDEYSAHWFTAVLAHCDTSLVCGSL